MAWSGGETSTGVLTPLPDIVDLAHRHDALVIVDAVTSLGGHEIRIDDWGVDLCYSGSQKCLGAPPGLAPITVGPRALEAINKRASKVPSFYFSLAELDNYWSEQRVYHHTAPVSMIYALREALRMMAEEGLQNRLDRHARVAAALRAGLGHPGNPGPGRTPAPARPPDRGPDSRRHRRRNGPPQAAGRLQHRDRRRLG